MELARQYTVVGTSLYVVPDKVTASVVAMRAALSAAPLAPVGESMDPLDSVDCDAESGGGGGGGGSPRWGSDVIASGSESSSKTKRDSYRGAEVPFLFLEEVFLFHRMSSYRSVQRLTLNPEP